MNSILVFNILHGLWPNTYADSKTMKRGTDLIVGNLNTDNTINTSNWGFNVGHCFRDALDIRLDTRLKDKKPYSVWTQGPIIKFKEGDLIFSRCKTYSVSVSYATQMGWDDEKNCMYEGSINFIVSRWHDENRFINHLGQVTLSQMNFLKLLVDEPTNSDNLNFSPVNSKFS